MPIEFYATEGGILARQSFNSPTVYLDHWAIRTFSDNHDIQERLVNALILKGGTLVLSQLSLAEFARATDSRHCRDCEAFIERLLPNIFFADCAEEKILEQERIEADNQRRFWPSADLSTLKYFCERAQNAPLGFTMHGFITLAHEYRTELVKSTDRAATEIVECIESVRKNPNFVRKTRSTIPDDRRPRTKVILGELIRGYILDRDAPISKNDAIDLQHAAMSVNCCDYVLLDGPWAERVEKMKLRIDQRQLLFPFSDN